MTLSRLILVLLICSFTRLVRADDAPKKPKPKSSAKDKTTPIAIADIKRDKPVDFQAEVLPILRRNCMACHNTAKAENHLVLETPQTIVKGGESGPAVEPKHSAESLLLKAAAHLDDPTMPPPDNNVKAVPLTPDELGLIKLWIDQGATGQVTSVAPQLHWRRLPATVQPILATAVSPDGDLAVCGRGSEIYVYELSTNSLLTRLVDPALAGQSGVGGPGIAHLDIVQALAFAPGGDLLASSGFRDVKLWQRSRNVHLADLAGSTAAVRVVAVSRDGSRAATGEAGGQIRLWELPSGKPLATISAHSAAVSGLRFLPDGSKLISGSLDKTVHAWNVPAGTDAGKIETPAPINALTLVRGGTQVCTGHADNVIRIWPLPGTAPPAVTPPAKPGDKDKPPAKPGDKPAASPAPVAVAPLKELKGHSGPVTALETFTPDGLQILSGSDDGTVRGWNIDNAQQTRQVSQARASLPSPSAPTATASPPPAQQLGASLECRQQSAGRRAARRSSHAGPHPRARTSRRAVARQGRCGEASRHRRRSPSKAGNRRRAEGQRLQDGRGESSRGEEDKRQGPARRQSQRREGP